MGKRRSGRKGYKPIEGAEHRIHRRRKNDSTTEWTRAAKAGKGTEYDSLCHRYLREIGAFRRDDDASLAANAAASVSAVAASGAAASTARDEGSKKALEHWGRLECFVLKYAAETEFGKFVKSLADIIGDGNAPTAADRANRLKFVKVDTNTLSGYLRHSTWCYVLLFAVQCVWVMGIDS